jgi:hypothetical protein
MKTYILLCLALVLSGCARPKPVTPPSPPAIQKVTYPKQSPPRPEDTLIRNCTVTQEAGNKADCICRKASTKIDAKDPGKQVLICK